MVGQFIFTAQWARVALLWMAFAGATAAAQPHTLEIEPRNEQGWFRLTATAPTTGVYRLEATTNFLDWISIGTTLDGFTNYPDAASPGYSARHYRFLLSEKTATNDWKNQVTLPADPFRSIPTGQGFDELRWIKFAIVRSDPYRVQYQDCRKFLFHYDFATERLAPFLGLSRPEFDQVSLHLETQEIVLGALLLPPAPNEAEYGIQFVGLDPYSPELIRDWFHLVKATAVTTPGVRAFYIPAYEQSATAATNQAYFAEHGVEVGSTARWLQDNQCYSAGWALGRLVFVPGTEIDQAYADGRLLPGDILLTDGVPAEIPFVAGVISLAPSTPNSHVAILARSFGVPFVYPSDASLRDRLLALAGGKIGLNVISLFEECVVEVIDLEGTLEPELEAEILNLKAPPALNLTPKAAFGRLSASTDGLTPSDTRYFGGKAANFGFLRRAIPSNSPVAIAFSFDLWDQFLDQALPGGQTLRGEIESRLGGFTYPPPVVEVRNELAAIRAMIRDQTQFTPAQQQQIISALGIFDSSRKIRFRSSTNVEDTEQFTGAGLYDSYSGCLLDDLDGDTTGPSHCDPEWDEERGVFRALRRVYASFYNENAFLERLRHGVDESTVGMAVLVHHSFPDDIELANGVATLLRQSASRINGDLVTQAGAFPVTNPEGTAQPEIIHAERYSFGTFLTPRQGSDLLPLGARVLEWEGEYRAFMDLFSLVAAGYSEAYPGKQRFLLDFEYKKMSPADLVVKQVRELPLTDPSEMLTPYLLHQSNCFTLFQGEYGDVFSNHALKSRWAFRTRNQQMDQAHLETSFYEEATIELLEGGAIIHLSGPLSSFSDAVYSVKGNEATDSWTTGSGPAHRRYRLTTYVRTSVSTTESPLLTLDDFELYLSVDYATPMPALDYQGNPIEVTNQAIRLAACPTVTPASLLQHRDIRLGAVNIQTRFYWPKEPRGQVAGYTAPLIRWVETTIDGLTSETIVLHGFYSQTYRPGHHNFSEEFIFEPGLEEGISEEILTELQAANIRYLRIEIDDLGPVIDILGLDGRFRKLEPKG